MPTPTRNIEKRYFPVLVVPVQSGWSIQLTSSPVPGTYLLAPGTTGGRKKPYVFRTRQEGWAFVQSIYRFHMKTGQWGPNPTRTSTCDSCGRMPADKESLYCRYCLKRNDHALQQLAPGIITDMVCAADTMTQLARLIKASQQKAIASRAHSQSHNYNHNYNHNMMDPDIFEWGTADRPKTQRVSSFYQKAQALKGSVS